MKKILAALAAASLTFAISACSGGEPETLDGAWIEVDADDDAWMGATIADGMITVNWVSDSGSTEALYWLGTAPDTAESWTSEGDTETMSTALLASGDDTKDFTVESGEISFELTALGVTTTIHLERDESTTEAAEDEPTATETAATVEEDEPADETETPDATEVASLDGDWVEAEIDSDTWMGATIADGMITVNWVSDDGDTRSLYWVGTAPEETGSWTSEGDTETMSTALLASGDDTKDFTVDGDEITFELTALGTTTTIHMVRAD